MTGQPLIWVLCGARAGDTAQAREVARRVGGTVVEKQLTFNALHALPNMLRSASFASLTRSAREQLAPPWPDLVIATGKRAAPVALAIKAQSNGKSKLVHIGRPRMRLSAFDLVITTPQYGLPSLANVVALSLPFALPKPVDAGAVARWTSTWQSLPRPWIMAAFGASKYPLRLANGDLVRWANALNAAAEKVGGSVLLFDSPRSADGALTRVRARLTVPHWSLDDGDTRGAYQAALAAADYLAVTGDSVSMASEMLATGKPVAVFRLPLRSSLRWSAQQGLAATFAQRGWLSPPRDVDGFMAALITEGKLGILGETWGRAGGDASAHDAAIQQIRRLLP